jgi:hypothetical protein
MATTPTIGTGLAALVVVVSAATAANADDSSAAILKKMSDYVASQKSISATFDSDIEIVTPDVQKIQFTSSGQVLLQRPDKLRVTRTGGYTDVEMVFDGKDIALTGKNANIFLKAAMPGSIDQMVDTLYDKFDTMLPGIDLLVTDAYDALMTDVIDTRHIGRGVVDGVECEHLAARSVEIDWQLWIEIGAKPVPRKYVITSKTMAGAPQYTLKIRDWQTDVNVAADAFKFKEPGGGRQVTFEALAEFDEVPPGVLPTKSATTGVKK